MKKNVLIFPCGSEIGLEIYRSLRFSTHFDVFGGSSVDDHGKFVFSNYIGGLPNVDDEQFVEAINKIVSKYGIDFIIPAHDSVVLTLAQAKAQGRLGCDVVTSPVKTCEVVRSKKKTYEFFKNILSVPQMYAVGQITSQKLPVFLKPDAGQGSKGTHLAKTLEEVSFYTKEDPSLLCLEYLPGNEYTVDCFTDKNGKLLFCEGRERRRILNGISVNSVTIKDDRFMNIANTINRELSFRGVWFFQVKQSSQGELTLMEIAPRVAGTMGLVRAKGVNLVLLSLFDAMGMGVNIFENTYDVVIDRALENVYQINIKYQHVYIDFDDLVIFEGKINTSMMAFVYQCINKGVKLHLITRHREILDKSLKKYRLQGIFDDLIVIKESDQKYIYIKEDDSIFIDDSFAERKQVYDERHIPTFDSHMLEALMEGS